ncbi:MAG: hypothetical protein P4L46_18220 [Fimbriimonas sp.]|nr:hypothetical protein [Fimbriimonas sp.]
MNNMRFMLMFVLSVLAAAAFGQQHPIYTDVHDFGFTVVNANGTSGPDGVSPYTGVTFDSAGNMYGTASTGGSTAAAGYGGGMVWEITVAGQYKDLHDFGGTVVNANGTQGRDGISPYAGVTVDSMGNLFGTTYQGGANGRGIVWEIRALGSYVDLHDFGGTVINTNGKYGPDGANPLADVSVDKAGNLYGTTSYGGPNIGSIGSSYSCGIVWEIDASGDYFDLHDFGGGVHNADGSVGLDGANPAAGVTFDTAGNMFGTTSGGGPNSAGNFGAGMIWKITASGTYKDLHDFGGPIINADGGIGADGANPGGAVTIDGNGNLYGTASQGGANDPAFTFAGMVWEITASGQYKDLHDFGGTVINANGTAGPDGSRPMQIVAFDQAGNMYGTTRDGGASGKDDDGYGTLWEIASAGRYWDLHDFGGSATSSNGTIVTDGHQPNTGVTISASGVLFGTAEWGGQLGTDTVGGMVWSLSGLAGPSVKSISIIPTSVVGGTSATGTVTMWAAASSGGARVNLSSSDPSAKVPVSITVGSGASSASFAITTSGVNSVTTVTIKAGSGTGIQSATLTISAAVLSSLALSPTKVAGGEDSTGTVTLSGPAGADGTWVALSDDSEFEEVPANVLVPEGKSSITFTVSTGPVSASTTATITATLNGATKSAELTIDPPTIQDISVDPAEVAGGNPSSGTVTLDGEAGPDGLVVSLSSNNPAVTLPKSVTVAGGQTEATFPVTTATVSKQEEATITASTGKVSQTITLTVNPPSLVAFSLSPSTVVGGASATGTVGLSGPAPTAGMTVMLSSDAHLATVPASVKVKPGLTVATFKVKTVAVATQYAAGISADLDDSTLSVTLKITPPALAALTIKPPSLTGGTSATGTVTLSGSAPAGGMPVSLSIAGSGSVPVSVTVPVNKTSATFTVKTVAVATNTTSTVTAMLGTVSKAATLTISAPTLKSLTLSPSSVAPGKSSNGTVTISSTAPTGGLVITLASSRSEATVPTTVTIAAGKTSVTFTVKTTKVKAKTTATISATLGSTPKTAVLTIT